VAGFCEHGDESSGSIKKAGYFFDKVECQAAVLKNPQSVFVPQIEKPSFALKHFVT
jgi:hypothetical protein